MYVKTACLKLKLCHIISLNVVHMMRLGVCYVNKYRLNVGIGIVFYLVVKDIQMN